MSGMKKQSQFLRGARILMTICGMWKINIKNTTHKIIYNIFSKILHGNYFIFVLTTVVGATCVLDDTLDFDTKSNYMTYFLFYSEVMWKMLIFQTKKITKIIDNIHDIEDSILAGKDAAAKDIYTIYSKYNINIFFLIAFGNVAVFGSFILRGITDIKSWSNEIPGNSTIKRSLNFQQWYPFDVDKYFEIAYLWQFVNALIPGVIHIACDSVFLSLIMFPVLRLDILGYQFQHFDDYSENRHERPEKILRVLLVNHQDIIRSVDDLNDALRWYFFGDFLVRSYQISLVLYHIETDSDLSDIAFLLSTLVMFLVQVFYMYFHANELILKSQDIGSHIYMSNWYGQPASIKSTLFITMIRTAKPLVLHIGNLDVMSNVVLIKIIKAGYTYVLLANK